MLYSCIIRPLKYQDGEPCCHPIMIDVPTPLLCAECLHSCMHDCRPTDLKPDKKKAKRNDPVRSLKRGESIARQTKKGDIVACLWKDSALVFNLSTCYDAVPNARHDLIDRRVRDEKSGAWSKTSYSWPPTIIEYNKYMGGVDIHDHIRSSYTLQRSCPKWWMYFAWFAIDVALVNAYMLHKERFPKETHKKFHLEVGAYN